MIPALAPGDKLIVTQDFSDGPKAQVALGDDDNIPVFHSAKARKLGYVWVIRARFGIEFQPSVAHGLPVLILRGGPVFITAPSQDDVVSFKCSVVDVVLCPCLAEGHLIKIAPGKVEVSRLTTAFVRRLRLGTDFTENAVLRF